MNLLKEAAAGFVLMQDTDNLLELEKEPNLIGWCWNTLTKTTMAMNEEMFSNEERQMTIFDVLGELDNV